MSVSRPVTEMRLVNGSTGDPVLFIDYPGKNDAFLFDAGELCGISLERLADLEAVFLTHFHIDHFVGFDRILRANLDRDKTLHIIGPAGTIEAIYTRIKSYAIQHFPFQKLVLRLTEVLGELRRSATLECLKRFPPPEVTELHAESPLIYETADMAVEVAPTDHTVPGLAYALVEKPGFHPDPERLAVGTLRPGRWVQEALGRLRAGQPHTTELEIDGGRFALGHLVDRYFVQTPGSRIAYVTDTAWSDASRPGLTRLAGRARRLYCDCYYARGQHREAAKHRHMTAVHAAELARAARVEELVLIHFGPRYAGRYPQLVEEAREIFPRTSAEL